MNNKENFLQKNIVVAVLAMICCFLWGSAFPCIKIGYSLFNIDGADVSSQILFAGARFTLAGILTIFFTSLISKKPLMPKRTSWGMVFKLCMVQTVIQYLLFYIALANTSGVKGSIIEASNVFISILISSLIFHYEKLGKWKILGCIFGFGGVVLINLTGAGIDSSMSFLGEGFMLLSAISYALSSVLIKKYSEYENPVILSGYQFTMGGIIMAAAGLLMGGKLSGFTFKSTMLLIYMALISAVAYSIWGILLKYNPVGKVAVYGFMNPVCGVILSAILLKEQNQAFTLQGLVSLILVCIGIYMVNKDFPELETKPVRANV